MLTLRPDQVEVVKGVSNAMKAGYRTVMLQAATGFGKTITAGYMMAKAAEAGKQCLFVAHRREIIMQTAETLWDIGAECGVIMAGVMPDENKRIQVASIQTLGARHLRADRMRWRLPEVDFLIIDEAHHAAAGTYKKLLDQTKGARVIGLTATPVRGDGYGLGNIFEYMVQSPSIAELTRMGNLVPAEYFGCYMPDMSGVKIVRGDYDERQSEVIMDDPKLVGDIVENYVRIANPRSAVLFATSVKHSIACRDAFIKAGINAEHLDGETDTRDRNEIIAACRSGKIQILCNVGIATEGTDIPIWSCLIDAAPTKSIGRHVQKIGRVLRNYPGKNDAFILDHAGNWHRNGMVHDITEWSLDTKTTIQERQEKKKEKEKKEFQLTCPNCSYIFSGTRICPQCHEEMPKVIYGKQMSYYDMELQRVEKTKKKPEKTIPTMDEKLIWWRMFRHIAIERKKPAWACTAYEFKFKEAPPRDMGLAQPTEEARRYEKYVNIRYAKGRGLIRTR